MVLMQQNLYIIILYFQDTYGELMVSSHFKVGDVVQVYKEDNDKTVV